MTQLGFVDLHSKGILLLFGEMLVHPIKKNPTLSKSTRC